ncbi:MAG: hypothetical protein FJ035_05720 [Chloroflexi bacterium]|nr:hypothetical protein [Chloroflexota bacterium]
MNEGTEPASPQAPEPVPAATASEAAGTADDALESRREAEDVKRVADASAPRVPASARQLPLTPVPELLATMARRVLPRGSTAPERPARAVAAVQPVITPGGVVLCVLFALACLMFVLVEPTPRWIALFGAAVAGLGVDGALRTARREPFASGADATPYVYLPAMFAFAAPVFIEYSVRGYWVVPAAVLASAMLTLLLAAEVASVRPLDRWYAPARFVAAAGAYAVTFALCALTYLFELAIEPAVIAVGLVGVLLAVELLRESEFDPLETLGLAAVTGVVLAQARWVLHYLPLDGYMAGLALVLVFYLTVGVLHAYVTRHLTAEVAGEYAAVTAAGLALVVAARATGMA